MQPYDPGEWTSLELHSVLCKLGATVGEACKLGATAGEAHEAATRQEPRHAQGRWDVGAGIFLDLREGFDFGHERPRAGATPDAVGEPSPHPWVDHHRGPPHRSRPRKIIHREDRLPLQPLPGAGRQGALVRA